MTTVTREYLPGLKLAQQFIAESVSEEAARDLDVLIAQASAAPEQEPAGLFRFCFDKQKWIQHRPKGLEFYHLFTPLYTHADPAEVEKVRRHHAEYMQNAENEKLAYSAEVAQLRAENDQLRQGFYQKVSDADLKRIEEFVQAKDLPKRALFLPVDASNLANMVNHMVREVQALRDQLAAATQRADAAERNLVKIADYTRHVIKCVRRNGEFAPLHMQQTDEIDALLSATAQPSECSRPIAAEPKETWLDMEELPDRTIGARYRMILDDAPQNCVEIDMEGTEKRWFYGDESGAYPIDEIQAWLPAEVKS